ncbi:SIMPL domain-containing protein [Candidatus Parcubacteria bacterium]|nr:SIMPL domain-containing protein [Patescibacteria group bacterium]MBU4309099.1 SIMPL domain-containing protein [Patescibacteria group bacterium]MBU4431945.1 SIMPL domain-containing protein [Patescibacteria group bacterium]MBU4577460.1 SIMPL domain-containing protein [Patescibacteria group bacterium]MCG2697148.1 SIMPL domain-containing protein [Candidatus Parcubacteria bacterium]
MQKTHTFLATLVILVVGAIVIVSLITTNKINNQDRFSVVGSGTVYAKADIANINVGLKTGAKKTAAEATKDSTAKMNSIIAELKKLKIDDKDIKTSDYNLNPIYNWTNNKGQELIGYEVTQTLTLKIRDLNIIGDVIAKTTEQGANQIGNINFTIDDEYALKNQARELAIQKAKEKAQMIADQAGMTLGAVKTVTENANPIVYPMYSNTKMELGMGGGGDALTSPTVQTGQNEIKVDVTLVYEVK